MGATCFDRIVFTDFDGTITTKEVFVEMMSTLAPDVTRQVLPRIHSLEVPAGSGVREIIGSMAASELLRIRDFAKKIRIRKGFADLVDYLHSREIPIVVLSAGLRLFVEEALAPFLDRLHAVYAAELDASGKNLRIFSAWETEACVVDKIRVARALGARETVVIGDSVTDIGLAQLGDTVFAREHLGEYLTQIGRPYLEWEDFNDIRRSLREMWSQDSTS